MYKSRNLPIRSRCMGVVVISGAGVSSSSSVKLDIWYRYLDIGKVYQSLIANN